MAIYHLYVKVGGRNEGRSAVAAAAYRSASQMENLYDGVTHDYTRKQGVVHTEILLPSYAPQEYKDRDTLWNAVELAEKAKDARLFREVEFSLPVELPLAEQIKLARSYIADNFVSEGMCADICIHNPPLVDDRGRPIKENGEPVTDEKEIVYRNPHAHVLLTVRPIDKATGKWQAKTQIEYICIKDGVEKGFTSEEYKSAALEGWERQYQYQQGKKKVWLTQAEGEAKQLKRCGRTPKTTRYGRENPITARWNDTERIFEWREKWAAYCNRALAEYGRPDVRIDARSKAAQGITDELNCITQSKISIQIDRRAARLQREGKEASLSYAGELNREIRKYNSLVRRMKKELADFKDSLRQTISSVRRKLEELRVSLILSAYQTAELQEQMPSDLREQYRQVSACQEALARCGQQMKETKAEKKKMEEALRGTRPWELGKKKDLRERIAVCQGRLEVLEEQRAGLPGQYGLEGWSEADVAEAAKSLAYIDRAMEQERQERKKQAADRTAFRRFFSGMTPQEQEAICKADMIRQEYTEEARQGLLAAWKERFLPSRFDRAVQDTDRDLGLARNQKAAKKHTLSL